MLFQREREKYKRDLERAYPYLVGGTALTLSPPNA